MSREEQRHFDVLVIGGGPAGIAAAACAAECGVRVGIVDDNPNLGGQIWRGGFDGQPNADALNWIQRLRMSGATALPGLRVVHQPEEGVLLAADGSFVKCAVGGCGSQATTLAWAESFWGVQGHAAAMDDQYVYWVAQGAAGDDVGQYGFPDAAIHRLAR